MKKRKSGQTAAASVGHALASSLMLIFVVARGVEALRFRNLGFIVFQIICRHAQSSPRQADLRRKNSYTRKPVAVTSTPNSASRGLPIPI
jgi:hypothetical protein